MAESGYFNTNSFQGRYLRFDWSIPDGGQDIEGNRTRINWILKGAGQAESGFYLSGNFKVTIDGTVVYQSADRIQLRDGTVVASGSVTLQHRNDGLKSFSAGAEAGIYSVDVNCRGNGSWELPAIARASEIDFAEDIFLGNLCYIRWTPRHRDFGYKLRFSIGNWSHTTEAIAPETTGAYVYANDVIPLEAASQIPNSRTGTMKATLYTYTDWTCTEQTGSPSTAYFTVTVPGSAAPKVSMRLFPVSSPAETYVQGLSKVEADFSESKGQYGASIESFEMKVNGKGYKVPPYRSDFITRSGYVEVKGTATDSRGYTSEVTRKILVIPYAPPSVIPYTGENRVICSRDDSGTHLKIKAGRKYSKVAAGGIQSNFCTLGYRYALSGEELPSEFTELIGREVFSDFADVVLPEVVFGRDSFYTVQLRVLDDFGKTSVLTFEIPADRVDFHLREGGKGAAFGRYAEEKETLDVDWKLKARKGINGAYIGTVGLGGSNVINIRAGNAGQTIFIFGSDGGTLINGIMHIKGDGTAVWNGAGNVTGEIKSDGTVAVNLPFSAQDRFTLISADYFELI